MPSSSKRLVTLVLAVLLGIAGLSSPAQASLAPKNPEPVNDTQVLTSPIQSNQSDIEAAASLHLKNLGTSWGIDPSQFQFDSTVQITDNLTVVRFTQHISGSIVLGALVALTVATDGSLISFTIKSGIKPASSRNNNPSDAVAVARSEFAKTYGLETKDVQVVYTRAAIADPTIVDYVSQSTWVNQVQLYRENSFGTDTYVINGSNEILFHNTDRKDAFASPLVCDMQLLDDSFSANKKLVQRGLISIQTKTFYPKKKLKEKKLTGIKKKRIWIVVTSNFAGGIASEIKRVYVPSGRYVRASLSFQNIPIGTSYSIYIGTGKKKPGVSALRLFRTGKVSSSSIKLMGRVPKSSATLASLGLGPSKTFSFININSGTPGLPICNYSNRAVVQTSADKFANNEKSKAFTYVNGFRDFMMAKVTSSPDINAEEFLGNVSPILNFGKNITCADGFEDGYCRPRISAFTNVCVTYSGSISCPQFDNAFWVPWRSSDCRSGVCSAIFIGRGFVSDDIVAHELMHGVTGALAFSSTSKSADAIAEAYSDFYGEAYDQLTVASGEGDESFGPIGEDVSIGRVVGPFRYLAANHVGEIPFINECFNPLGEGHANLGPYDRFVWLITHGGNPQLNTNLCAGGTNVSLNAPSSMDALVPGSVQASFELMLNLMWTVLPNLGTPSGGSAAGSADFATQVSAAANFLNFSTSQKATIDNALLATGFVTPAG